MRDALRRLVNRLEQDFHAREDLFQEACVHFWLQEQEDPGRSRSWYLQSVKFHLNDFRKAGRSLDSPKRPSSRELFPDYDDDWEQWHVRFEFDEGFLSAVNARDIFSVLADRLEPMDRRILSEFADGFGVCEIAARLSVSHVAVLKRRRRIEKLAIRLGINPVARPLRRGSP